MRFISLIFVCALIVSACGSDIQVGIDQATDLMYQQKYVDSERLYQKLLSRIENSGALSEAENAMRRQILDRLGNLNTFYLRNYSAAIKFYEKLAREYSTSDEAFVALATIADIYHHRLGRLENAIDSYQKLIAQFPEKAESRRTQLQVVQAYFQLKNYSQARTEAEFLVNRWPKSKEAAEAKFQIANSYYLQKRYSESVATLELLLEDEPEPQFGALILFELGNCFQEMEEIEKALAYFYAALADHPNPRLVQGKIRRVRARWHKVKPAEGIHLPDYMKRRAESSSDAPAKAVVNKAPKIANPASRVDLAPGEINDPIEPTSPPTTQSPSKKVVVEAEKPSPAPEATPQPQKEPKEAPKVEKSPAAPKPAPAEPVPAAPAPSPAGE